MKRVLFIIIILLFTANLNATVRYVSKTGSATPPYLSWTTAARTIKQCVQVCQYWDTILVGKGTFKEDTLYLRDNLTLLGSGIDSTIIDIRQGTVYYFDNNKIKYFSFLAGDERYKGVWVALRPNKLTQNLIFEGNKIINGERGIYLTQKGGTNLVVKNNFFSFSERGMFLSSESSTTKTFIENNVFNCTVGINSGFGGKHTIRDNIFNIMAYNDGVPGGPAYYGGEIGDTAYIKNNIILSEYASSFALEMVGEYAEIENNSFLGKYYIKCFWIGRNALIRNNLLLSLEKNGSAGFQYLYGTSGNPIINYNLVHNFSVPAEGFYLNNTNLLSDPMVVNQDTFTTFDAHLQMYSPAIDAGDPAILDKDGTRSDIGYYGGPGGESYNYLNLPPKKVKGITVLGQADKWKFTFTGGTEADFKEFNLHWSNTQGFVPSSSNIKIAGKSTSLYIDKASLPLGQNYFKVTAIDSAGNRSIPSDEVSIKTVDVKDGEVNVLLQYELYPAYPNPFNPSAVLSFNLANASHAVLNVYDIKGELVETIVNDYLEAGYYEYTFTSKNSNQFASGIFVYKLDVKDENNKPVFNDMGKMILMK